MLPVWDIQKKQKINKCTEKISEKAKLEEEL